MSRTQPRVAGGRGGKLRNVGALEKLERQATASPLEPLERKRGLPTP